MQVPGFVLLIYGTLIFNDVVRVPSFFPKDMSPTVLFSNPHAVVDPFEEVVDQDDV